MAAGRGQRAAAALAGTSRPWLRHDLGHLRRFGITAPARPACIEWAFSGARNVCKASRGLYLSAALIPKGSAGLPRAGSQGLLSGRQACRYAADSVSPASCAA